MGNRVAQVKLLWRRGTKDRVAGRHQGNMRQKLQRVPPVPHFLFEKLHMLDTQESRISVPRDPVES